MPEIQVRRIALPGALLCALLLQPVRLVLPEVVCLARGGSRLERADLLGRCLCPLPSQLETADSLEPLQSAIRSSWQNGEAAGRGCADIEASGGWSLGRFVFAAGGTGAAPCTAPAALSLLSSMVTAAAAPGPAPPIATGPDLSIFRRLRC